MHVHVPKVSKSKMALELENYITALPNDVIKTAGIGKHSLRVTASYKFGCDNSLSRKSISCAMYTINVLFEWTIGRLTLKEVNQHFLLMNNVGMLFRMLSSIKPMHENIV